MRINVTTEDLKRSLAKVKMKSSPSLSGISYRHIKLLFDALPDEITLAFNDGLNNECIHPEWTQVAIKPLLKPNKDKHQVSS